jgi:hypothetical protein
MTNRTAGPSWQAAADPKRTVTFSLRISVLRQDRRNSRKAQFQTLLQSVS